MTASSGSPALDAQTCRLVWLRAKFTLARDQTGAPVEFTYQQRINWRIGDDDDGATSEPWTVRWVVSGWDYALPSCRSGIGGALETRNLTMSTVHRGNRRLMTRQSKVHSDLVIEQRFSLGPMPTFRLAPGEQLVGREFARLDIDAAGKIVSCKVLEMVGRVPPQLSRTRVISAKQYAPRKDASGSPEPFTAYFMTGVYARQRQSRIHCFG